MEKLRECPFCGGEMMLCQTAMGIAWMPDYSAICTGCGMEFKTHRSPETNMFMPYEDAMKQLIERFNVRCANETEEMVCCSECKHQDECVQRIELIKRDPVLETNTYESHPLCCCSYGEQKER